MSNALEAKIYFYEVAEKWRFDIEIGKYRIGGFGSTIEEAEKKADFALTGVPNHDIVHRMYLNGKSIAVNSGSLSSSTDGF